MTKRMIAAGEDSKITFQRLNILQTYSTDGIIILLYFLMLQFTIFAIATRSRGEVGAWDGFQCLFAGHAVRVMRKAARATITAVSTVEKELTE